MEEGELTVVDSTPIAPANPSLDSLTDEQLKQQIGETIALQKQEDNKSKEEADKALTQAVNPEVVPPAPVTQAPQTQQAPVPAVQTHAPMTPEQSAFAELQAKKGIKTPDELAKSYVSLQKDYTKKTQELANMKRTAPVMAPPVQVQQPPVYQGGDVDYAQANEIFKQSLQNDALGTIAQAIAYIQEHSPQAEQIREQALSQEAIALATNPKTADFTSPEITQEINNILAERPNEAVNLEKNLKRLFYEARGRVQDTVETRNIEAGKKIQEQSILNKKSAALESGNGAAVNNGRVTNDPNTMPLADLKEAIMRLSK